MKGVGPDLRTVKLNGHVGFDTLPHQIVNRQLSEGFTFNILCVGETGLGKSTLMETLFNQKFDLAPSSNEHQQVKLKSSTFDLQEDNVKLRICITETSGFGDQLNKEDSAKAILDYINHQYENFLQEEMKVKRSLNSFQDTRIHACLYFISPTGHSLKSLDLVTMKKLEDQVNLVPLIAKSDTITKSELQKFKSRILSDMASSNIHVCHFPTDEEGISEQNTKLNSLIPFAIVGGTEPLILPGGRRGRGRQYPWGAVCVDSESHCDTGPLRTALLSLNTEHMRHVTCSEYYERYRCRRLLEMGFSDEERISLRDMYERQWEAQSAAFQSAEEAARQQVLSRVREAEVDLKREEAALMARFDSDKRKFADEANRLEEQRRKLDAEVEEFRQRQGAAAVAAASAANASRGGGNGVGFLGGPFNSLNRARKK